MMPNMKKHTPSPEIVVSTGCSRIKSYLFLPRRQQPSSSKAYIKRRDTQLELELELSQRQALLSTAKKLADQLCSFAEREEQEVTIIKAQLMRLPDGSYLRNVNKTGRPWGRLVMQISSPTIALNGSNATEVLRAMALMEKEELHDCLVEQIPMGDISGCDPGEIQMEAVVPGSEDGFMEALLLGAMENIEWLVTEGLRTQMSSTRRAPKDTENKANERSKCAVLVMLIQVRDPNDDHKAVGELMIGLIEASAANVGEKKYHIEGVHVAGFNHGSKRNIGGKEYMWRVSM